MATMTAKASCWKMIEGEWDFRRDGKSFRGFEGTWISAWSVFG
jgi:hypothetical protein